MTIETQEDVLALKKVGRIVSVTLQTMLDAAEPGITTRELDMIGGRLLQGHGARSAPQLTYGFPGFTCISINEEAAHGVPGDRIIRAGDVLNIDVSAELNGYFADTGGTTVIPPTTPKKTRLCHAAQTALTAAMNGARAGQPINLIWRRPRAARGSGAHRRLLRRLGPTHAGGRNGHHHRALPVDPLSHRHRDF